jgi:site-specific DNA-methyltransferase (adenine-specific)
MPQENISVEKGQNYLLVGDNSVWLKKIPDNSIDSIVTDPPAGISFMARGWDSDKGGRDNWIKWMSDVATECKRVLKPGGHAFVWAIPRTSHWTATAWENAGFEIRDVVAHVFGSGFSKSHNIEKAVQKIQPERSNEFKGIGTALKPAREDWILMRKPLEKGLNVAENCLKWGTGGINIDKSRVGKEGGGTHCDNRDVEGNCLGHNNAGKSTSGETIHAKETGEVMGRFPANLIHDNSEEVRECFPETKSVKSQTTNERYLSGNDNTKQSGDGKLMYGKISPENTHNDSGNASRFFKSIAYYPKASKSERNRGCEGLEEKPKVFNGQSDKPSTDMKDVEKRFTTLPKANNHPTVKPIALCEYLIKMVTRPGGVVLDPFAGSGSTLVAAKQNGFQYIGIEMTEEYIPIIEARLNSVETTLFN